ncbi:AurF N-oxygenase family protein [Smaragdicoccus niigatensis]|uniref:AurF N-oxygenase family protein n=1 Tax=Smaragdicoccus niigatensis TaxID=359359 RepID=UPI00036036EF|nr:diiron oxygenase [Smaragdicoccus niigatensis]
MTLSVSPRLLPENAYEDLLKTLSEGSVRRKFDPFLDIDWDAPHMAIDKNDPRWQLNGKLDPLGITSWYKSLPVEERIRIGRIRQANAIKVGAAFENLLIRGLLGFTSRMPNDSVEFRYCMHEITEETNHIQMFQELVNRIGEDVPGMRPFWRLVQTPAAAVGPYLETLMFMFILGGEEPIDHYQKAAIRDDAEENMPPAVVRAMQIHVAEEARHISFAHEFLKRRIPQLDPVSKLGASIAMPVIMRFLCDQLVVPPAALVKEMNVPDSVMKEAFWGGHEQQKILSGFFIDVRKLAEEVGLMNPISRRVWKLMGIYGGTSRYRSEPDRRANLRSVKTA